jgi:DNA-nicking Smr family endonuclease
MTTGSGRRLRADERELWKGFTRAIAPLKPQKPSDPEPHDPELSTRVGTARKATIKSKPTPVSAAPVKSTARQLPALAPLSRRMKQRLARGTEDIEARLDLHGRTQAQAHNALLGFLRGAQAKGAKNVLVITGKGARSAHGEQGVLKRQVPLWLKLPEFREFVVSFEQAHIGHGGEGALYVRVRRA